MKRYVLLFVIIGVGAYLNSVHAADFRNTVWGATKEQVKRAETEKLTKEDESTLQYTGSVAGFRVQFNYTFSERGLKSGGYAFPIFVQDPLLATVFSSQGMFTMTPRQDYSKVQRLMVEKYGKPLAEDYIPPSIDETGRFTPLASSVWVTDNTMIVHMVAKLALADTPPMTSHILNYSFMPKDKRDTTIAEIKKVKKQGL